jgi:hypothetical protein
MKTVFQYQTSVKGDKGPEKTTEVITLSILKKIVRSIKSPDFIHARWRSWCGCAVVSIYHKSSKSPSGKELVSGGYAELIEPLLKRYGRTSPLSPTEGLGR